MGGGGGGGGRKGGPRHFQGGRLPPCPHKKQKQKQGQMSIMARKLFVTRVIECLADNFALLMNIAFRIAMQNIMFLLARTSVQTSLM